MANPGIDAVVVVVKRNLSYGLIKSALESGKHVHTEKPLCLDPAHAQELVKIARDKGVTLNVGYMKRHDLGVKGYRNFIRERMDSDSPILVGIYHYGGDSYWNPINQVRTLIRPETPVSEEESIPRDVDSAWHPAYENFINTFSHSFDLIEHLTGGTLTNPVAKVDNKGYGVTTFDLVLEDHSRTVPISFQSAECNTSTWEDGLEIIFPGMITKLRLSPPLLKNAPAEWSIISGKSPQSSYTYFAKPSWAFVEQAQSFVEGIREGKNWVDEAAARHVGLVHSIFRN